MQQASYGIWITKYSMLESRWKCTPWMAKNRDNKNNSTFFLNSKPHSFSLKSQITHRNRKHTSKLKMQLQYYGNKSIYYCTSNYLRNRPTTYPRYNTWFQNFNNETLGLQRHNKYRIICGDFVSFGFWCFELYGAQRLWIISKSP